MITIDTTWAMVELFFDFKGSRVHGFLWWNTSGDVLFKDDGGQWNRVIDYEGGMGIDIKIKSMRRISNSEIDLKVQI